MFNIFCLEGGKCNRRYSLVLVSLFVIVIGWFVVSLGIFWFRKDWNKYYKYFGKCSIRYILFF